MVLVGTSDLIRISWRYLQRSGTAFLHSKQICHRDIKPQNAMLLGLRLRNRHRRKAFGSEVMSRSQMPNFASGTLA